MRARIAGLLAGAAALAVGGKVFAAIMGAAIGTTSQPTTLFGITYTPFNADGSAESSLVSTVQAPSGDFITFDAARTHDIVPSTWATWSNGYTGDVYYDAPQSLTITLPAQTNGFYFYAESSPFETFTFTATTVNGPTLIDPNINGASGAGGFVYWTTTGDFLSSITISAPIDFAVGEFGISQVPEPTSVGILAVAGMLLTRRSRKS